MTNETTTSPLSKFAAAVSKGVSDETSKVRVSFKEGSTQNKLAVLGGVSTGITFTLQGLKNLRSGWAKDQKTGKRDIATTMLGAAEIGGGLFLTGLFYHNLRLGNDIMPAISKFKDRLTGQDSGGHSR